MDAAPRNGARAEPAKNPFEVLGLRTSASAREIEREGQKRLAMIAAGVADDCSPEAEHRIRHALDELRDARRRLFHEIGTEGLTPAELEGGVLARDVDALERALPNEGPTTHALAEELLARALPTADDGVLPADHDARRAEAFARKAPRGGASPLEIDWAEMVAVSLPTKPPKGAPAK